MQDFIELEPTLPDVEELNINDRDISNAPQDRDNMYNETASTEKNEVSESAEEIPKESCNQQTNEMNTDELDEMVAKDDEAKEIQMMTDSTKEEDVNKNGSEDTEINPMSKELKMTEISGKQSEQNIRILRNINLNSSFKDHLFWPSPITTQRKSSKDRLPAAISSAEYRKYLEEKESLQIKQQLEKDKRKEIKRLRVAEKKNDPPKKKKRKLKKEIDEADDIFSKREPMKCASCDEELVSDVEDDDLKNVECDNCIRWFHLRCTEFVGLSYSEVEIKISLVCTVCKSRLFTYVRS